MALWGNNDNINSVGTVTLNYSTLVVTGAGTSFGQVGSASTGDVIRFGIAPGTNFGSAVIVGIASTTQLSIASTAGLSGSAISAQQFDISQSPKYTTLDSAYRGGISASNTTVVLTTQATSNPGIGTTAIFVTSGVIGIRTGDFFASGANTGLAVISFGTTSITLASGLTAGITTGASVVITRLTGARTVFVAGVSTAGAQSADNTVFEEGVGWVGIQTYIDFWGNMRVKKEILVAMSGIQTGNTPLYDSNPLV
jgi:hypothetical protein